MEAKNNAFIINRKSPMKFIISKYEYQYAKYFKGKLSFYEITQRLASELSISELQAFQECINVYLKFEDKLSAIVLM